MVIVDPSSAHAHGTGYVPVLATPLSVSRYVVVQVHWPAASSRIESARISCVERPYWSLNCQFMYGSGAPLTVRSVYIPVMDPGPEESLHASKKMLTVARTSVRIGETRFRSQSGWRVRR